jgi:hypothetical protein
MRVSLAGFTAQRAPKDGFHRRRSSATLLMADETSAQLFQAAQQGIPREAPRC